MSNPDELTCQELVALVTDYLEGALSPAERLRFEEHLAECTGCRNYLVQFRLALRIVGSIGVEPISDQSRAAMLDLFRQQKPADEQ